MEAKSLLVEIEQVMEKFLHREIFIMYRIPKKIFTDGRAQFTSKHIIAIIDLY